MHDFIFFQMDIQPRILHGQGWLNSNKFQWPMFVTQMTCFYCLTHKFIDERWLNPIFIAQIPIPTS